MNYSVNSDRAAAIIATLMKLRFLPLKEKWLLLKNCPSHNLVGRLLSLAFKNHIFRFDLKDICKNQTIILKNADERLASFVRLHEDFFNDAITGKEARKKLFSLMEELHVREYAFYEDLLSGGTCFLDFLTFKKFFVAKDSSIVRFMRPKAATEDYSWVGKQFVVQPNYQGLQVKIILQKNKKPKLISGDQTNYANKMKATLKLAGGFLDVVQMEHMEFDAIIFPKDKQNRLSSDWKAVDCALCVYDFVEEKTPLKKRLKVVAAFCNYMRKNKNKRVIMMPTEIVSGPLVTKAAKSYTRSSNPFVTRNGILVKKWDSSYVYKRSADWLTFFPISDTESGNFLGRATIMGFNESFTKIYGKDNNGLEVEVLGSPNLLRKLNKYVGYTVEYSLYRGSLSFKRVLYSKGREV